MCQLWHVGRLNSQELSRPVTFASQTVINDNQNLNKTETCDLERIPGACRANRVFAESNGHTFALIQTETDEADTKINEEESKSLYQDLVQLFLDGSGAEHTINFTMPVHGQLFETRFGTDFFEYNNRSIPLSQSELENQILLIYRNQPILSGPLSSEPIDLNRLEKNISVVGLDGQIRTNSMILSARSEYFKTMLSGRWVETQNNSVKLDLPKDILQAGIKLTWKTFHLFGF